MNGDDDDDDDDDVQIKCESEASFHSNARSNARIARDASACVGNHHWLLRSSIPIGWRLRSLREKNRIGSGVAFSYAMTACVNLRDFRLRTFVFLLA